MERNAKSIPLALVILSTVLNTISQTPIQIQKLEGDIEFDGIPNEAAWNKTTPFPMIMHVPTFGLEPSLQSDVRLLYDENYFYVGASMFVSDPDLIQAYGKKRDFKSETTDYLGISFDTYNDKENALFFVTNPNGLRMDGTVINDATADESEPLNLNWNAFWEVKTLIEDSAWYAEFKIPISSLRFRESDSDVTMGLSIYRFVPGLNEYDIFPEIPYGWNIYSKSKPSQFAEVKFPGIKPRKPLYISPYLLTGFEQTNKLNDEVSEYEYTVDPKVEPGIDIKYGINTNTTLDLTVNTDFAQVEADDQQFTLDRFSLYYEEKRTFFLERAGVFNFGLGGANTLFYSRRIGLHNGQPVRILGGARLVTKVNKWDIGALDMQTASFMDLPSENFGVFRAKRKVFNPYSYAGGMLTSRIGVDGSYNLAYGIDGVFKLFGSEFVTIRWAQTFDDQIETKPFSLDPVRYLIGWERRRQNGLSYSLLQTRSGSDFEPGIGLELFQNYLITRAILKYTWLSPEKSPLQNHYISAIAYHLNDVVSSDLLMALVSPVWGFRTKDAWGGSINFNYNYQFLAGEFGITENVSVAPGTYEYFNASLILNTPGSLPYRSNLTISAGQYYDGINFSPALEPAMNIGASLELAGTYKFDYVRFDERNQQLSNHIFGIRGLYMISTKLSLSAFIQYNTAIDKVISNLRFRYNPKEGTDLYIVFNEGRNTYLERTVPNQPLYDARSVMLKFIYTFDL